MKQLLLVTALLMTFVNVNFAAIIYVDASATGSNNGSSWTDAYTSLQSALDNANNGDEIWIAKGIYRPSKDKTGSSSPTNARTKTFYINKNISIHGSFDGTEATLNDRQLTAPNILNPNISTEATVLSGDLGNDENDINLGASSYIGTPESSTSDDNSYTVVHIANKIVTMTGLIVTQGSAFNYFGGTNEQVQGGGIYNEGTLSLSSSILSGNFAYDKGGCIYSTGQVTVVGCTFLGNLANTAGGAAYHKATSTYYNAVFLGNAANGSGGGVYNDGTTSLITPTHVNGMWVQNVSNAGNGGSIYNNGNGAGCVFTMINNSLVQGQASAGNGGAIYTEGFAAVPATTFNVIINSIFYNCSAATADMFYHTNNASTSISYSAIQGANATAESVGTVTAGSGMLYDKDPQFVSTSILTLDLSLKTSSSCINAGDNSVLESNGISTDAQGGNRFYCNVADMGALERSNGKGELNRRKTITLNGSNQYVDLGSVISDFNDGQSFTVEGWVKVNGYDVNATTETIVTNRSGNTGMTFGIAGLQDASNDGKLVLHIGTSESIYGTGQIPANEWTHVALTFDYVGGNANIVKFYINGYEDLTFNTANNINASTANTLLGYESGANDALNCNMEEFRFWSDVRTTAQIREALRLLMPCGAESALATYQFNDNVNNALELGSTPAGDYSGTTVGSPTYSNTNFPIGSGISQTFTISGAGTHTLTGFNESALAVTFGATNHPNGDIVVSYLGQTSGGTAPFNDKITGLNSNQYHIDNYGADTSGLDFNLKFYPTDAADLSEAASEFSLEKRWGSSTDRWYVVKTEADNVSNVSSNKFLSFDLTNSSFGQFMPTEGNLVPVEMTFFTAILKGTSVQLDWQTASEIQNQGFQIEKSNNGKNWETIGFVAGAGTTFEIQNYQFTDTKPFTGSNYYRLKQLDLDGGFEYSEVRWVVVATEKEAFTFFPNPAGNELNLSFNDLDGVATVQIFDLTGRLILQQLSQTDATNLLLDLSGLNNGLYFLQIQTNDWKRTEKIVVRK